MLLLVDDRLLTCYAAKSDLFDAENGVLQNSRQTQTNDAVCEEGSLCTWGFSFLPK
jgi:hypothetical protein